MQWILSRVCAESAVALSLGSAVVGATAVRIVFPDAPESAILLAAMMGVLGLAAGLRPNQPEEEASIEWLAVIGMLVCVPPAAALASPSAVCLAAFLAPPAGLALAALWWSLLSALRHLGPPYSYEDPARARQIAARWLSLVAGLSVPTAMLAGDVPLTITAVFIVVVSASRAAAASIERQRSREWLDRVRRGREPRYRVMPEDAFTRAELYGLPPLLRSSAPLDGVLVELAPCGRASRESGPYRTHTVGLPRARVPLVRRERMPVSFRRSLAIAGAMSAPIVSLVVSALVADVMSQGGASCASGTDLLCGWLLLLSGPSTGAALLVVSSVHRPARGAVWWLGIAIYLLACPFVCLMISMAARISCH